MTGSFDNTARVWDLEADNPSASAKVLRGHVGPIWALALSTDGKRLATGSEDGTARVWDLEADDPGASAKVLKGHDGPIRALALSTDGKRLASGSDDRTVRVWLIEIDDLLTVANRVVGRGLTEEEREMYDLED